MIFLSCTSSVIHICKSLRCQHAFLPSHPCFICVDPWPLPPAPLVPLVVHSSLDAAQRSSAAPNPSSTLPKCSSRAQLEPFVFEPLRATPSRQTPCETSPEKTTSHLSPKPNASRPDPEISKRPTLPDGSSHAQLSLNLSAPLSRQPLPTNDLRTPAAKTSQNLSALSSLGPLRPKLPNSIMIPIHCPFTN